MNRIVLPTPVRLIVAGAAGYLITRAFCVRWHDTVYYDLRYASRTEQVLEELAVLLLPLVIALLLQLFSGGRNDLLGTAAVASLACAYVAARHITLAGWDNAR